MYKPRESKRLEHIDGEPAKKCFKCKTVKKLIEFNKSSKHSFGVDNNCRDCETIRSQSRKEEKRNYRLETHYGINQSEYYILYINQEGCCRICKEFQPTLVIDHCHNSDLIRGLLCSNCNSGLGLFNDSIEKLENAIQYLKDNRNE